MTEAKSKRGRPKLPAEHKSAARLVARCTAAELEAVELAAARAGETVADYVRRAVALRVATGA